MKGLTQWGIGAAIALLAGSGALLWTGSELGSPRLGQPPAPPAWDAVAWAEDLDGQPLAQMPPEDGPPPDAGEAPGDRGPRWLQDLDLSPEQLEQMQAIRAQYDDQMRDQHDQLRTARDEMHELLKDPDTSTDRLRQQHAALQTLQQSLGDLRFESMLEMRELLTPAQRATLAERMDQRHGGNWGDRPGPGGRGSNGPGGGPGGRGPGGREPGGGPRGFW